MKLKIPVWYSDRNVDITLPDGAIVDLFDLPARRLSPVSSNHWVNSHQAPEALCDFIAASRRLLIVVNDRYRPTPTAQILRSLESAIDFASTRILVATGLHPATSSVDNKFQFGVLADKVASILHIHDAADENHLTAFGSGDKAVRLNSLFAWCDSILTIGSVEPHYFAGFTGGRKIILPGCASFADVERNHAHAVSAASQPLARQGNPVYDDIQTRTAALDEIPRQSIQVVCDHDQNIYFAASGDWDESFNLACDFVIANYSRAVSGKYDLVISVVYPPLDRNLYQLQKSYENVQSSVRDGGTILLISACRDGIGDERFLKIAAEFASAGVSAFENNAKLIMGIHKVARTITLAKRVDLVLCSTLDASLLQHLPIAAHNQLQATIDELISKYGNKCKIAVVLDAASQVLYHHAA